jgi:hypothetical protein
LRKSGQQISYEALLSFYASYTYVLYNLLFKCYMSCYKHKPVIAQIHFLEFKTFLSLYCSNILFNLSVAAQNDESASQRRHQNIATSPTLHRRSQNPE